MTNPTRSIKYKFLFEDGKSWNFEFEFDHAQHLASKHPAPGRPWTRLEYHQCQRCPLHKAQSPFCPVAKNLDAIVEESRGAISFTKAHVTVETPERTFVSDSTVQDGLRSLFGLLMASSGCPHLDWLRPLARFHLPFANVEENLFRVLAVQLLEGLLGEDPKRLLFAAETIQSRYQHINDLNRAFMQRIRAYCSADADKNALAALDLFVQFFEVHHEANFEVLRPYFRPPGPPPVKPNSGK